MEIGKLTYLVILAASVSAPLALSFDSKVRYFSKLKYIFPAILLTAVVFWFWDVRFTASQVWKFNSDYVMGISILEMPVEEWLFFIVIPYCCVFIYEVLKYYLDSFEHPRFFGIVSLILVLAFLAVSISFRHQAYTFLTFILSALVLFVNAIRARFRPHVTKFYLSFLVSLIPFVVVNGILTSLPVVEYNSAQIMNMRFLSIPVEDFSYFFLLHLMVISIYETIKERMKVRPFPGKKMG